MSAVTEIRDACDQFRKDKGTEPTKVFLGKAQWNRIRSTDASELRREANSMPGLLHGKWWYYTDAESELRVE